MPGRNGIKWKVGEKADLERALRNFNARRRYAIKKNPDLVNYLPTMPVKSTVNTIKTRKDLTNLKREIELSKKKGAFEIAKVGNVKLTNFELSVQKRKLRQLNAKRAAARKKAGVSTVKGTMGTIAQNNLNKKKLAKPKSRLEWEKFKTSIEKMLADNYDDEKSKQYRANYYAAFLENYGLSEAVELMEILEKLTHQEIAQAMHDNPKLNIEFLYDDREEWDLAYHDEIIEEWKEYLKKLGY